MKGARPQPAGAAYGPHQTPGQDANRAASPCPPGEAWRRRRVFPGHQQELSQLRRWLTWLLPECAARDDLLSVATELASNALEHTASGKPGGSFTVQVARHQSMVYVAVTDGGSLGEPRVIEDPDGERGRGLLLVHGLSARTGWTGDEQGRVVWAQIPWPGPGPYIADCSPDPCQSATGEGEAALARRVATVAALFGRPAAAWRAVTGRAGLMSATTAQKLTGLPCPVPGIADPPPAAGQPRGPARLRRRAVLPGLAAWGGVIGPVPDGRAAAAGASR